MIKTHYTSQHVQIEKEQMLHDGFVQVVRLALKHRLFAGGWTPIIQRELVRQRAAVGVILYDPKRKEVVLCEQFRTGAVQDKRGPWLLEPVAGLVEPGEADEQVAVRESFEEAGCMIKTLIPIGDYYTSPGANDAHMRLFCGIIDAADVGGIYGNPDEHEDIFLHVIRLSDAERLLKENKIQNVNAIVSLQWLLLNFSVIPAE